LYIAEFFDDYGHVRENIDSALIGLGQMNFDGSRVEVVINVLSQTADIPASVTVSSELNEDSFNTIVVNGHELTSDFDMSNSYLVDDALMNENEFGCAVALLRAIGALIANHGV